MGIVVPLSGEVSEKLGDCFLLSLEYKSKSLFKFPQLFPCLSTSPCNLEINLVLPMKFLL